MSHEALVDAATTATEFHQPADHDLFMDSPIEYMLREHVTGKPTHAAGQALPEFSTCPDYG